MRPGAGQYIIYAGTGVCVHTPFRLNPDNYKWSMPKLRSMTQKMESAQTAASGPTSNDNDMVRPEKWSTVPLYLDELLG